LITVVKISALAFTELKRSRLNSSKDIPGVLSCRVCANTDGSRFDANDFLWFHCRSCGTVQKAITREEYFAINPSYDPGQYLDSRSRAEVERFLDVGGKEKLLSEVLRKYSCHHDRAQRGRFLDVGCGMGGYMLAARRLGFEVMGFEPSNDHAHVATATFGLPVVSDYFKPELVGEGKFDLIMLSHVIEHIYAPAEMIFNLVSVLRPGGILLVITPNVDSLVARLTGRLWPMLKPVDHVTMIGARAYEHFGLPGEIAVHHRTSEFSFEFMATILSIAKSGVKGRQAVKQETPVTAARDAGVLRETTLSSQVVRAALTVISSPALALATALNSRACLTSTLVRSANP
jgi:2-polyprenyl-3-methyl-5-hydroxy-6-metoxy-1,4-benzoquinol methylase